MDEYIKKADALNASKIVYIECLYLDDEEYEEGESDEIPVVFRRDIEAIPAADVRPVVRGEWRHITDDLWDGGGATECSACGFGFADGAFFEVSDFRYCPNCGAYMRGERHDDCV